MKKLKQVYSLKELEEHLNDGWKLISNYQDYQTSYMLTTGRVSTTNTVYVIEKELP